MKIKRDVDEGDYPCDMVIEHLHNHPIQSLEVISFRSISENVVNKVTSLFEAGLTPSNAYHEFVQDLRRECESELKFHLRKADRSICPRRRDFNTMYATFCKDLFGGKNGEAIFSQLEHKIEQYM